MGKGEKRKKTTYFDYSLFFIIIFLLGFGFVMLYSTSAYTATLKLGDSAYYLKKQMFASALGFVAMLFFVKIDYRVLKAFAGPAYLIAFLLCVAVIFSGRNINGSSRWLYFGPVSVQPSEIAKVAIILYLATVISRNPKAVRDKRMVLKLMGNILPIFGVVAYTNLSTGVIIFGIAFVMLFVASPDYRTFITIIFGAVALGAVFIMVASYRATRLMVWRHPEQYDEGYQTLQGLYAIGSGGLFGKGLGESMQKLFVPEANNDMIFSIICEELGLFGAICIIVMYMILIWRFVYIATHARDMFGSFLVIGIMTHISLQVLLNIAVVTNTIPNTGITLPFVSYGGTSMAILIGEMGVALSVSRGMEFEA